MYKTVELENIKWETNLTEDYVFLETEGVLFDIQDQEVTTENTFTQYIGATKCTLGCTYEDSNYRELLRVLLLDGYELNEIKHLSVVMILSVIISANEDIEKHFPGNLRELGLSGRAVVNLQKAITLGTVRIV